MPLFGRSLPDFCCPPEEFERSVGRVNAIGTKMQLVIPLKVTFANGDSKILKALIDTGAMANLIRPSIVAHSLSCISRNPITLVAANSGRIPGGDREVDTVLNFRQQLDGKMLPETLNLKCPFYLADIGIDMILSYPWLAEKRSIF